MHSPLNSFGYWTLNKYYYYYYSMINTCFTEYKIPKVWRQSRIIAILKPGKDASIPKSYSPFQFMCTSIMNHYMSILCLPNFHTYNKSYGGAIRLCIRSFAAYFVIKSGGRILWEFSRLSHASPLLCGEKKHNIIYNNRTITINEI